MRLISTWVAVFAIGLATATGNVAPIFRYNTDQIGLFMQEGGPISQNITSYFDIGLGLRNRTYDSDASFDPQGQKTPWQRFAHYVQSLNERANPDTQYKLLYLARHGEGYHNIAQSYYGSECWDCYWSQQDGNGSISWKDAELTTKGHVQIARANSFWRSTANTAMVPFPQRFYTSPMARCLSTVNETFSDLPSWTTTHPFKPMIKELLREPINACTCSWRHSKSWIEARFPRFAFEAGFSEEDQSWKAGLVESSSAQISRLSRVLDDVFSSDSNTFISITTHAGIINPILQIIGHPNPGFSIPTGEVIPVLVTAQGVDGSGGRVSGDPPSTAKTCAKCSPK